MLSTSSKKITCSSRCWYSIENKANGVMWLFTLALNRRAGMTIDFGVLVTGLAPLTLVLGVVPAAVCVSVLTFLAIRGAAIFREEEKRIVLASLREFRILRFGPTRPLPRPTSPKGR